MENKICPIKPEDVTKEKEKLIPEEVFLAFNEMIAKKWSGFSSTFKQKDVVALIIQYAVNKESTSHYDTDSFKKAYERRLYNENLLDIEDVYRSAGWKVYYDKPGYNETYDATFCFSKK